MTTRREMLKAAAAATGAAVAAPLLNFGRFRLFASSPTDYSERAVRLVRESIVVDMLNQFRFPDYAERPPRIFRWLRTPGAFTRDDFEAYRASGIRVFALGAGAYDYEDGLRFFAENNGFIAAYPDWFLRIDDAGDFERARREGKVGIMLTMQRSEHLRTADDVDTFFALGQRVSQLTYNYQNRVGAGFLEKNDGGLTVFGASMVERMNKVGMAVDLSHCGDRTTLDGLAASKKPALFTHAACRALLPPSYTRCKTDEMIRLLAKGGGVMGIPFIRFMIREKDPTGVEHVVDHVEHVARLVGIEHVGVGSDLDLLGNGRPMNAPSTDPTTGRPVLDPTKQPNAERYHIRMAADGREGADRLDHPKRTYDLAEGLIARKYSDADIRLVLGGNWVRVLSQIWPA